MKFTFKPSPVYRNAQSTSNIMRDLSLCLVVVLCASSIYYGVTYGMDVALRVILMAVFAVIAAVVSEALYFKVTKVEDIKSAILHSYGWVTALILVLITKVDVSYYAVIVCTVIAVIVGKLLFGGFGQNIFNPAAFGEALIMNSFVSSTNADVTSKVFDAISGGTPMAGAASGYGWLIPSANFSEFLSQYGGFGNMLLGNYPSVIGGSCAIVILLCGAFLIWRKDIDWHVSVTYLVSIFVISLIVGLIKGAGFSYALFNVLGGGVLFGAVFMITDPVTTPLTIPGRIIFAVATAALTLILRWKANLPDGVLFSILLMNMLTPAIDRFINGNQIKEAGKIRNKVLIVSLVVTLIAILVGATLKSEAEETAMVKNMEVAAEVTSKGV